PSEIWSAGAYHPAKVPALRLAILGPTGLDVSRAAPPLPLLPSRPGSRSTRPVRASGECSEAPSSPPSRLRFAPSPPAPAGTPGSLSRSCVPSLRLPWQASLAALLLCDQTVCAGSAKGQGRKTHVRGAIRAFV